MLSSQLGQKRGNDMRNQISLYIGVITLLASSTTAHADLATKRAPTRIDFNRMIDEGNAKRQELQQDMNAASPDADAAVPSATTAAKKANRNNVSDFLDLEIGVGEAPSMVDRRFDSVGPARVVRPADLRELIEEGQGS